MGVSWFEPWYHAHVGLIVAAVLALFGAWMASISRIKGRAEPGRASFIFAEVMMILYMVYLAMVVAGDMLFLKQSKLYNSEMEIDGDWWGEVKRSMEKGLIVQTIGLVCSIIANALLLFSLVELGNGLMFMLKQQRSKSQKIMRYFALSVAAVMFILQLAIIPLMHKFFPITWIPFGDDGELDDDVDADSLFNEMNKGLWTISQLNLTYDVLNLVTAIAVLVYASVVMHAYRNVKSTRGCAIAFLTMAILFFTRAMWLFVYRVTFHYHTSYYILPIEAELMLDVFLNYWLYTAILLTLFFLALKKQGGIWTTEQPWMRTKKSLPSVEENRSW
ncbi:hypothetical protein EDB81DRAFT_140700 [Dactylonectria macrodidyma]|uniref:Uncharacterized protein n=1 Tax=Dactylonectria macrodidyma TaxID=307937 RepID=A0A9P9DW12_9HYPO|nr:hypothetical protein EDB81DRAFT_140700 [Dactylonectria macrodidyma]